MAQIQVNPWSFNSSDQATSVAIASIVNNGASALVTTSGAHGYTLYQNISLQAPAVAGYANGYKVLSIPSTTTFNVALEPWQILLANAGAGGNSLSVAYAMKVRIEQILWNNPTAATALLITDTNGFIVWNPESVTGGTLTYGKIFWVDGIVLNTIGSGTVQMTIN
jgi:hypothetical protein